MTRGIVNKKWSMSYKEKKAKQLIFSIIDLHVRLIKKEIWEERCEVAIELEKQTGITKIMKRKNRRIDEDGSESDDKIANYKNKKKIKKIE